MYFLLSVGLKFECLITCRMFLPGVLACGPIIALISGGPPQIRLQVELHHNRQAREGGCTVEDIACRRSCTKTDKLENGTVEDIVACRRSCTKTDKLEKDAAQ